MWSDNLIKDLVSDLFDLTYAFILRLIGWEAWLYILCWNRKTAKIMSPRQYKDVLERNLKWDQ